MKPTTTDFRERDHGPYFLWDEDLSIDEFESRLRGPDLLNACVC